MPQLKKREVLGFKYTSEDHPRADPLLQRIYGARGLTSSDELARSLKQLPSPHLLRGCDKAVDLLIDAIKQQHCVLIVGDFDADGATSSCLMVLALKALGLLNVQYLVPNRFDYGYGLTPEIVEQALLYRPDIIVTVDNGIASHDGINLAQSQGIKVIVTDHHLPGDTLPKAEAIVNPNQPDCRFPSKAIAGVGVAFFLLLALRKALRDIGYFEQQGISEPNLAEFLDLVALGTIADVVPLDTVNRILVYQGLLRIKAGKCRPGIKALLSIAKRDFSYIVASDLGFAIGPRLNAAGRLDDMSVGIACLLADSHDEAYLIATELDALNADRRQIEQGMQQEAERAIAALDTDTGDLPAGLCLYKEGWHQGVVGIVASRIKDKHYRPVIAFAKTEGGDLKGSARSIAGVHIRDVLALIAVENPNVLSKFGGHAMAAGLSLKFEHLEKFEQLFSQAITRLYSSEVFNNILLTDGVLQPSELNLNTALLLENAGPWGQLFSEPCFENSFIIKSQRLLADKHLKLSLQIKGSALTVQAIAFNVDTSLWPNTHVNSVKLAYRLNVNRYRGSESAQLLVDYLEAEI